VVVAKDVGRAGVILVLLRTDDRHITGDGHRTTEEVIRGAVRGNELRARGPRRGLAVEPENVGRPPVGAAHIIPRRSHHDDVAGGGHRGGESIAAREDRPDQLRFLGPRLDGRVVAIDIDLSGPGVGGIEGSHGGDVSRDAHGVAEMVPHVRVGGQELGLLDPAGTVEPVHVASSAVAPEGTVLWRVGFMAILGWRGGAAGPLPCPCPGSPRDDSQLGKIRRAFALPIRSQDKIHRLHSRAPRSATSVR